MNTDKNIQDVSSALIGFDQCPKVLIFAGLAA